MLRFILCLIHHQHITLTFLFFFVFFLFLLAMFAMMIRAKTDSKTNRFKQFACFLSPNLTECVYIRSFEHTTDIELGKELSLSNIIIQIDRINFKWRKQKKTTKTRRKSVDRKCSLKTHFLKIILWGIVWVFRCS